MKTKLKSVEAKMYQGKPNGFKIILADGTEGNLSEKESDKDLKAGEEVECVITDYVSKAGKHSNLFTITRISQSATPPPSLQETTIEIPSLKGISKARTKDEMDFALRIYVWREIMRCFAQGVVKRTEIGEYFNENVSLIDASMDKVKTRNC